MATTIAPSIVTDSEKVEFKTTDQSMWSTGQAFTINESWTIFEEGFSDSFSAFDDDLTVSASASVSLVFSVQADAGSISLKYPVDVSFQIPNVVTAGQQFTVQSVNNGLDGSATHFDAKFPEFKVDLNAIFTADFSLNFDSDLFGSDSAGYNYNDTIKLISLHSGDKKTIVDGFDVFLPKDYDPSLTSEQSGSGALADVTLDVTTPDIATVDVDVLAVIEDIVGPEFPSLSGSFLDGDISYNLLTAELDAGLAITQQFQFLPTEIDVTLTAPWGESVTIPVGQSATFNVPYYWDKETTLTASYSLQGNLVNQTGFIGTATLNLTALGGNVDLFDYGPFGPLYTDDIPVYNSGAIYIYNPGGPGGFAFEGFNTPTHNLKIEYGTGTLVAPGDFALDGSGFTANDAALIQATLNSIAAASGATGTNAYTAGGSGSADAEAGKLNLQLVDSPAASAFLGFGFDAGFIWASGEGGALTGNLESRLLAAAPKRGGTATLTAGGNELMVAGQTGQVTFNITTSFNGMIAGLQAGDIINVSDMQAIDVYFDGSTLTLLRSAFDRYEVALSGELTDVSFQVASDGGSGMLLTLVGPPPTPGTEGDDTITGSSGSETLNGGAGNDAIFGGGGSDTIDLGSGADTLGGYWGDMNGDIVSGFTSNDRIDITGSLIGRSNVDVALGTGTATLTAAGSSIQLNGDFTGGDFMVITRGTGAEAHTTVTFENYLPPLREGVSVDPDLINGVTNEAFLTGDGFVHFTVDFKSAASGYANTLGTYHVAADGTISDVQILFDNTRDTTSASVDLGVPANNVRIGFFLIQDGSGQYGSLPNDLSFQAPGGGAAADLDAGLPPTLTSATLGALTAVPIFHSFSTLNPDDAVQVLSGVSPGGQQLLIGFEDLVSSIGDNDFQDVVISVRVDTDNMFLVV
ncbi:DUF4114 domain-containing protein [Reyranella sp.]|uniref:DUF4114 domain-containing protein n=1 Tax=Reyranella sp. TaxID=1929291 RepID=UPI003F70AD18